MPKRDNELDPLDDDPLWYKDAVIYETHVRAFCDSNADGMGDFRGLTQKLEYLQDLGVSAIWLLPFFPSPLRDDGYDIADFTRINPAYGTLGDFHAFVREAHRRGLRVITELVLNHTSDQHPWFQKSRRAKSGDSWRNYYVWSDSIEKYRDSRIIFKDFETSNWSWDPVAKSYYWHRFYSHQPDLNFDNPQVHKAIFDVLEFWLKSGVDGVRLDAIPYLYEREGTTCENLPETHVFLKQLRRHVEAKFKNRMFLAEANQWPEDAAAYFGDGDECHMNFHFPLMPRLFMAIRMEDRFPIIDILDQTPTIPDSCQWGLFLRNHDELTLEMVTDEERDYMYRAYAHDGQARINLGIRRRLAPLLGNDRRRIELMNSLLFSLPGTPVLYYGDEIGMGDNFYLGDRNGVRTPMQWSADRNAGFSRANPHQLYLPVIIDPEYHYEAVNVDVQQNNPYSLLWWMKRMLSHRKRFKVFGRGTIEFLHPGNRKVLAFIRRHQDEVILIVANLSRYSQCVELDLSAFRGATPMDLFGQTPFIRIDDRPYPITLGPYTFYWFSLEPLSREAGEVRAALERTLPALGVTGAWDQLLRGQERHALERILPRYLRPRRWFAGKAKVIQSTSLIQSIPIPQDAPEAWLTLIKVEYTDGEPETYCLPLAYRSGAAAVQFEGTPAAIAHVHTRGKKGQEPSGLLYDAMWDPHFLATWFEMVSRGRRITGSFGELTSTLTPSFRSLLKSAKQFLEPSILGGEQSNTSVSFGDLFILKLYRRLEPGINPDFEVGRFLTERTFPNIAPIASGVEYHRGDRDRTTVAILQSFVPNEGDAWQYTLDTISRFYEDVLARRAECDASLIPQKSLLALAADDVPLPVREMIGLYLEDARLLGQRTGELHLALSSDTIDPTFSPEPFTDFYRRGLYQSMHGHVTKVFALLRQRMKLLPAELQGHAKGALDAESRVRKSFLLLRDRKIRTMRIRCHGDYHLGQVLHTGKDFIIIDFEGEPDRPLSVRQLKGSPLRDVAGMLRSFHYAAYTPLLGQVSGIRPEDFPSLDPWARVWQFWVSAAYLRAYMDTTTAASFLPTSGEERQILLDAYMLEKVVYELGYELNSRPDWVRVPLEGIRQLLETEHS